MATKKTAGKKQKKTNKKQKITSFFEFITFGESYTSLIFGIVSIIIATVLVLSFIQKMQAPKPEQQAKQQQEKKDTEIASLSGEVVLTITETPTPTDAQILTAASTVKTSPSPIPTKVIEKKKTATPTPTKNDKKEPKQKSTGKTYTVVAGDSLWSISEKVYKSGYYWVEIAKANKLANPSDIHSGNKLILPKVTPIVALEKQVEKQQKSTPVVAKKITGKTYKVVKGDTLWDISVKVYGDGYQWKRIAEANKLSANPGLIHSGNVIIIPRK